MVCVLEQLNGVVGSWGCVARGTVSRVTKLFAIDLPLLGFFPSRFPPKRQTIACEHVSGGAICGRRFKYPAVFIFDVDQESVYGVFVLSKNAS